MKKYIKTKARKKTPHKPQTKKGPKNAARELIEHQTRLLAALNATEAALQLIHARTSEALDAVQYIMEG